MIATTKTPKCEYGGSTDGTAEFFRCIIPAEHVVVLPAMGVAVVCPYHLPNARAFQRLLKAAAL